MKRLLLAPFLIGFFSPAIAKETCKFQSEFSPNVTIEVSTKHLSLARGFVKHKGEKVLTFETGATNGYGGQYFIIGEIPKSSSEKAERIVWTDVVTLVGDQLGGTPKAKRKKGGQVKLFLPRFAKGYYYSLASDEGKPDGRFEGRTQKMTDILIAAEGFWIPSKECEKYAYERFRF